MSKIGRTCLLSDTSLRNRTQVLVFHLLGFFCAPFYFLFCLQLVSPLYASMQVRSQSENTTVFFFSCQLFKLPPIPVSVPRFPLFRSPLSYLRRASLSSAVGVHQQAKLGRLMVAFGAYGRSTSLFFSGPAGSVVGSVPVLLCSSSLEIVLGQKR